MDKYFVFCWYPKNWLPRAIFIPLEYVDERLESEIKQLVSFGPIITEITKKEGDGYTRIGHYTNNGKLANYTEELTILLSTWERRADNGFECFCDNECNCPSYMKLSFGYYINDANRNLSPYELYNKLSLMTSFEDKHSFAVENCVMMTEHSDLTNPKPKPLRVFYNSEVQMNKTDLESILIKNFDLSQVILSGEEEVLSGYGYVHLNDYNKQNDLVNKIFKSQGLTVFFDEH